MRPPITPTPGIPADWNAIGNSIRDANAPAETANDPQARGDLVEAERDWEDEGGSLRQPKVPPAPRP